MGYLREERDGDVAANFINSGADSIDICYRLVWGVEQRDWWAVRQVDGVVVMVGLKKLAIDFLLPLVILIVVVAMYFGGSFPELKEKVGDVKNYVKFGAEQQLGTTPTIPPDHLDAVNKLISTMKEMKESTVPSCFANYGGLPDLGAKGTSVTFTYDALNDRTIVSVLGGVEGVQEISSEELKGIRPCVIAGKYTNENDIARNFQYTLLTPNSNQVKGDYYMDVKTVSIKSSTSGVNGNFIRTSEPDFSFDSNNFQDGGWLFTPDNKRICFFPTTDGTSCEGEYGGLQDNCLADAGSGDDFAVVNLLSAGKINYCVQKDQALRYKWIELSTLGSNSPEQSLERVKNRCIDGDVTCHTSRWQCDSRIPDALPSQGCRVLATDPGNFFSSSGCADGFAESGSLIPGLFSTINFEAFTSGESISYAAGDPNAKNILTKNFRWANSVPLICAEDHLWYACNQLLEGKTIQLGNTFAGKMFAGPVKVQCILEEGQYSFKEILDFDNDGVPEGEDSSLYKGQCRSGQKEGCFDNCPAKACVGKIVETSPNKYTSLTVADCANPNQEDTDSDGVGNSCDLCPDLPMSVVGGVTYEGNVKKEVQRLAGKDGCPDGDLDGIIDTKDNCPPSACEGKKIESVIIGQSKTLTAYDCDNPDQRDSDLDKIGDVCDSDKVSFVE